MKKILTLLLTVFFVFLYGCQAEAPVSGETSPPLSDGGSLSPDNENDPSKEDPKDPAADGGEEVGDDEGLDVPFDYVSGDVIGKMSPNILLLQVNRWQSETLGETVCVITEDIDSWKYGDSIEVSFSKVEPPSDESPYARIIADKIFRLAVMAKPIIYLYPEKPTVCSVTLALDGRLTCTYPSYADGWECFTAYPDGTLIFPDQKEYYALYWEGVQNAVWDFSQGFCVRGEDTAAFLEWALAEQGLIPREANEFIIYWLPLMQDNPYNVISFQTATYTDGAALAIDPAPDALLRVFMAYYSTETEIAIDPQSFVGFERRGFTVVEWGGTAVTMP